MVLIDLVLFLASMFILTKAANYITLYAVRLAKVFDFSEFFVSFFFVSVFSTLPEFSISLLSVFEGSPSFGLGTLLGSNVADLTLVMGLVAVYSMHGIRVDESVIKNSWFYVLLLFLPFLLGFDGFFSRVDGLILMFSGFLFFFILSLDDGLLKKGFNTVNNQLFLYNLLFLVVSVLLLLFGAHYTIFFGLGLANALGIPPILIGLTLVSIGTCLPELIFSLSSVRSEHEAFALGNVLGTVVIDATLILGFISFNMPFSFDPSYIYFTGLCMFFSGIFVMYAMWSGSVLSRREGFLLLFLYVLYLLVEFSFKSFL